jgi:hypothetical protein
MTKPLLAGCCALSAALLFAGSARAEVCGANGSPVVYVVGTGKSYTATLAKPLYVDAKPITVVWIGTGSCTAVTAVLANTPLATLPNTNPATGSGFYWPPSGESTCTIPTNDAGVASTDIAASDVFATTCGSLPNGLPTDVGDYFGPSQAFGFIVPKGSPQRAISAAAAYFVYGFGAAGGVTPYTDDSFIYKRGASSGTVQILSAGIGVPAAKWKGTDGGLDKDIVAKVIGSSAPEKTIGIVAQSFLNTDPQLAIALNFLAYKHYGQSCAYYPDSTPTSKDKANVRDGHYALWGPVHYLTKLDASGNVRNPSAKRVIDYLTQITKPPGNLDLIQFDAANYLIPTCAMKVQRSIEMGPMKRFAPNYACGCYYEQVATGRSTCQACTGNPGCPPSAPTCSYGFCETQ